MSILRSKLIEDDIFFVIILALFRTQGERLCEIMHFIPTSPLENQRHLTSARRLRGVGKCKNVDLRIFFATLSIRPLNLHKISEPANNIERCCWSSYEVSLLDPVSLSWFFDIYVKMTPQGHFSDWISCCYRLMEVHLPPTAHKAKWVLSAGGENMIAPLA